LGGVGIQICRRNLTRWYLVGEAAMTITELLDKVRRTQSINPYTGQMVQGEITIRKILAHPLNFSQSEVTGVVAQVVLFMAQEMENQSCAGSSSPTPSSGQAVP
jgi:hypothetical protein